MNLASTIKKSQVRSPNQKEQKYAVVPGGGRTLDLDMSDHKTKKNSVAYKSHAVTTPLQERQLQNPQTRPIFPTHLPSSLKAACTRHLQLHIPLLQEMRRPQVIPPSLLANLESVLVADDGAHQTLQVLALGSARLEVSMCDVHWEHEEKRQGRRLG